MLPLVVDDLRKADKVELLPGMLSLFPGVSLDKTPFAEFTK